eukprot:scaffold65950_cov62-Phaeocystis_antarctica.AAC.1
MRTTLTLLRPHHPLPPRLAQSACTLRRAPRRCHQHLVRVRVRVRVRVGVRVGVRVRFRVRVRVRFLPPAPAGTSSTAVRSSTPCGSAILGMAWSVTIRIMWTFRGTAHAPALSALTAAQKRSDQVGRRTSAALLPSSARLGPDAIQEAVSCATLDAAETALIAAGRLSETTVLAATVSLSVSTSDIFGYPKANTLSQGGITNDGAKRARQGADRTWRYRSSSGRRTWYMVQGKQRSANVQAPSSAVQQACRGAPARRQLRSGLGGQSGPTRLPHHVARSMPCTASTIDLSH